MGTVFPPGALPPAQTPSEVTVGRPDSAKSISPMKSNIISLPQLENIFFCLEICQLSMHNKIAILLISPCTKTSW